MEMVYRSGPEVSEYIQIFFIVDPRSLNRLNTFQKPCVPSVLICQLLHTCILGSYLSDAAVYTQKRMPINTSLTKICSTVRMWLAANDAIVYIRNRHHHSNNKILVPSPRRLTYYSLYLPFLIRVHFPSYKKLFFFSSVDPNFMTSVPTYSITVQCVLWLHSIVFALQYCASPKVSNILFQQPVELGSFPASPHLRSRHLSQSYQLLSASHISIGYIQQFLVSNNFLQLD